MVPVRDAAEHQGNLNAGLCILQKPDVLHGSFGRAQLELHTRTREYFAVTLAVIFESRTFEGRGHCDRRRRRRNEIAQRERDDAHDRRDRRQSLEQLPTAESQHAYLPELQ
jgi:hypothetical protein